MNDVTLIPVALFCRHYHIDTAFLQALHEVDLLAITTVESVEYLHPDDLHTVEKLVRVHQELGIDPEGLSAVSHLLVQLDTLQQEVVRLQNRLRLYEGH